MPTPVQQHSSDRGELFSELNSLLSKVSAHHYRLLWLAGGAANDRSQVLQFYSEDLTPTPINVGLELSRALIDTPPAQRAATALDLFSELLADKSVIILDRLEILFESSLLLNPLDLVKTASRHRVIIASWPGDILDGAFRFGPDGHPSSQSYPVDTTEDYFLTLHP
jgi:hypothetical protein